MANGTSAIELMKKEASQKIANANRRAREKGLENTLVHKGALLTTAALYGSLNRMDVPIEIGGFPWKLGVTGLALLAEGMTKGTTQAVAGGVADATLAIYIERSISTNTLVAGDDDWDDDDDDAGGEGSCGGEV